MSFVRQLKLLSLAGIVVSLLGSAACRSAGENGNPPADLIVVNATRTGTVKRILVGEDTEVTENTVLLEIAVPSGASSANSDNRPPAQSQIPNQGRALADAEQELQRAAVELQRIEPLVMSNSAPQAQLDAARAQYQKAQERLDRVRSAAQAPPAAIAPQSGNELPAQISPASSENIVAIRAPAAGNVRVISMQAGQVVKAGEPVATILQKR